MSFHDVEFPRQISYGSLGGPAFNTTVLMLNSGFEKRNINWSEVRASYEVAQAIKSRQQMTVLLDFFYARQGRAYSFRFFDWMDFSTGFQTIGTGDGVKSQFQLVKVYESGPYTYTRDITKPISGTLTGLKVGGVDRTTFYSVDYNTGIITFTGTLPQVGEAITIDDVEFNVHTRFDIDQMEATHDFWETMSWPSIPIVEVKE